MRNKKKVTAIVSVFNEQRTVREVVISLINSKLVDEVIVINDGSTDKTAQTLKNLLKSYKFDYLEFEKNKGKSYAMASGVEMSKGEIIVFVDADIIGLESRHIEKLLIPLITDNADMIIGQPYPDESKKKIDLLKPLELLAGERVVYKQDIMPIVKKMKTTKYGVETLMNLHYKSQNKRIKIEYLWGLTHLKKFQKDGLQVSLKSYSSETLHIFKTMAINYVLIFSIVRNLILRGYFKW